jgi:hypothetical protein
MIVNPPARRIDDRQAALKTWFVGRIRRDGLIVLGAA